MFRKLDFMSFKAWITNGFYYVRFYFLAYLMGYFDNPPQNDITKKGFELIFNDEFDLPPINWDVWSACETWGCIRMPDNPKLIYKAEQVTVENGCAVMTTELNQPTDPIYTEFENAEPEPLVKSGEVTSHKCLDVMYGYFETREKLPPDGFNNWAAFWAYPTDAWPPEIDVFELMGKDSSYITMTLHYAEWEENKGKLSHLIGEINDKYGWKATTPEEVFRLMGVKTNNLLKISLPQEKQAYVDALLSFRSTGNRPRRLKFPRRDFLAKDFHTYAVYWSPKKIVWYIDNKAVYVLDKHLPTLPMYWLITNAVTDKYETPPTTLPSKVYCDYFRAYKEL